MFTFLVKPDDLGGESVIEGSLTDSKSVIFALRKKNVSGGVESEQESEASGQRVSRKVKRRAESE